MTEQALLEFALALRRFYPEFYEQAGLVITFFVPKNADKLKLFCEHARPCGIVDLFSTVEEIQACLEKVGFKRGSENADSIIFKRE
jgi:hypothetical protein